MYGVKWKTSERKYDILVERNVKIPMSDGITIDADIFRPDNDGSFPGILGMHCYAQHPQTAPIKPYSFSSFSFLHPLEDKGRGWIEAGDPNFFVRRGYVHVIANVRGTGESEGQYQWLGPREVEDAHEVIEWISKQKWCNGELGMFGVSYFAMIQLLAASLNPPSLKCIFAPWALTDYYRDSYYHGGILRYERALDFPYALSNPRLKNFAQERLGDKEFERAITYTLQDEDIAGVPTLVDIAKNPDEKRNRFPLNILLHPLDGPFWEERRPTYEQIKIPAYIGGCWGNYGLHLPGAFRSWENLNVPKKMIIGPPLYIDRPVYQPQYESLRWFDYWLKGIDTGIMDEPPVRLFVMGTNQWKESDDWPLPETKWTPFYLHEDWLLSEHEHWPNESSDSFEDSPWQRGYLAYYSPPLVEDTEVIGPIVLELFASTTDKEVFWIISLREIDQQGNERILTRGWLRGTHREIDPKRSKPWEPFHPHTSSEPLIPGKIYKFSIPIVSTGNLFKAGSKIALRISCVDDEPKNALEAIAVGHLRRQSSSRITVYHNADYPSHLLLPITMGNILGTFLSGGKPYV